MAALREARVRSEAGEAPGVVAFPAILEGAEGLVGADDAAELAGALGGLWSMGSRCGPGVAHAAAGLGLRAPGFRV